MAITITRPVAGLASTSNASSYNMTAFTPTANSLLVLATGPAGFNGIPTISGGGLTWVQDVNTSLASFSQFTLFTAVVGASPVSTTINIATSSASTGMIGMILQVVGSDNNPGNMWTNTDSGVASANANLTFGTPLTTTNAYAMFWIGQLSAPASTPPTGWTETDDISFINPAQSGSAAYRIGGESSSTYSFTNTSTRWAIMGIEFTPASVGGTITRKLSLLGVG